MTPESAETTETAAETPAETAEPLLAPGPQAGVTPLTTPTIVGRGHFVDLRKDQGLVAHAGARARFVVHPSDFALADFGATAWNQKFNIMSDGTITPITLGNWMY